MSSGSGSGSRGGGQGSHRGRGRGGRGSANGTRRNGDLAEVAKETIAVLPDIIRRIPHVNPAYSEEADLPSLPPLRPADCPHHGPATVRIVNEDTINEALNVAAQYPRDAGLVAILNLASDYHAGGGWLKGARAQEEALCYRSSLYLSLHREYYPFRSVTTCLYTPDMVVIRGDMTSGHDLLVPSVAPVDLPILSAISVAALRNPPTANERVQLPQADGGMLTVDRKVFAKPQDREVTKAKMRVILRMAASRGHSLLVLGALGCGAFHNPSGEVARCWKEVLKEAEFTGGWWRDVVFAVFDKRNEGNFEVFKETLEGVRV